MISPQIPPSLRFPQIPSLRFLLPSDSSFPLHYVVFKQTASHLPHEGNSEQLFSRSGALSDDNAKMDPTRLAVWTWIGVNYSTYQPSYQQILERYLLKFSKGGNASSLHDDDLGLLNEDREGGEYYVTPSDGDGV